MELINWICQQASGFFTPNPEIDAQQLRAEMLIATQTLVKGFSDMLEAVSQSIADDGMISQAEAQHIREHWETLKRTAESFVVSSESGLFYNQA